MGSGVVFSNKKMEYVVETGKDFLWLVIPESTEKVIKGATVRDHDDGSKKLNACILSLSHMVYLQPKHRSMLFAESTHEINVCA